MQLTIAKTSSYFMQAYRKDTSVAMQDSKMSSEPVMFRCVDMPR
jgi:hypothetical protein